MMAITAHVHQIFIAADAHQVWTAITDSDWTERYLRSTRFLSPPTVGTGYRTVSPSGADAVEGTIVEMAPPTSTTPGRFVQTWRVLYDAALAAEPPSQVEWTVQQVADGLTRVRLVHGDLAFSPLTWAHVKDQWVWVLDGLKTVLETGASLPAVPNDPNTIEAWDIPEISSDWHRTQAVEANNATWELLGRNERTPEEDEDLLRRAYAAAYHWHRVSSATPANEARAAYMITKALLATGQVERGLTSADHCVQVCLDHGLVDFDLAYAHEARTRALLALGREADALEAWSRATLIEIADAEDKQIVDTDFADLTAAFAGMSR
jgi:uncharacterized protein YndB with AHSA1/START domain